MHCQNKNFVTNKTFWNTVRPFITNKGTISDENIKIKAEENQNIKNVLVDMFNYHYKNIFEKTSGIAPGSIEDSFLSQNFKTL